MLVGWPETRSDPVNMDPGANALAPVARRSANAVKERPPLNIFVTGPGLVRWKHSFYEQVMTDILRTGYDQHIKPVVTLQMVKN